MANADTKSRSKASIWEASLNMANSIVGTGVVAIPFSIAQSGLALGIVLMITVAAVSVFTLRLLVRVSEGKENVHGYQELVRLAFGPIGYVGVSFFMFIYNFGAMCAYLLVVVDSLPAIVALTLGADSMFAGRNAAAVVVLTCVVVPLCMLRDMSVLSRASFLSMLSVFGVIGLVVGRGLSSISTSFYPVTPSPLVWWSPDFIESLGTISFIFVCHDSTFYFYRSMRQQNLASWELVTYSATLIAGCCCIFFGVAGYLIFLDETKDNILNNFADDDLAANVARALMVSQMCLTVPLSCYAARASLNSLLSFGLEVAGGRPGLPSAADGSAPKEGSQLIDWTVDLDKDPLALGLSLEDSSMLSSAPPPPPLPMKEAMPSAGSDSTANGPKGPLVVVRAAGGAMFQGSPRLRRQPDRAQSLATDSDCDSADTDDDELLDMSYPRHVVLTLALVASASVIAIVFGHLSIVYELTGGFSAVCLAFVLPCLCYLKLEIRSQPQGHPQRVPWEARSVILILLFGVIAMISCTGRTLLHICGF